ncbi:amidohydrolase family protein, partial [Clostridium sp.]|uniref:amidohydrolase family protein n=1 Tax=Clostridium sp. TaxID=1506 RepID=UPI001A602853
MRSAIILVLQNARVLEELTPDFKGDFADIVIDGDRIADILPAGSAVTGEIINVNGKTVLPGFIDAHVHLDLSGMDTWQENTQSDAFRVLRAASLAQDNLKKGFTTLRDLGDRNNIIIDLSNAVRNGFVVAPDILASGMIISPTERGNNFFENMYAEADGKYEVVKAVRKQ